jgi:hypothetical protein
MATHLKPGMGPGEAEVQGILHLGLVGDNGRRIRLNPEGRTQRNLLASRSRDYELVEVQKGQIAEGHT